MIFKSQINSYCNRKTFSLLLYFSRGKTEVELRERSIIFKSDQWMLLLKQDPNVHIMSVMGESEGEIFYWKFALCSEDSLVRMSVKVLLQQ